MSAKLGAAVVALAIAVAWTPNAVFGGVSNLSQERTVTAYVDFGNSDDPPPPEATIRSDKAGKFDRSAESHVRNDLGDHSDAITSQTSTIGNNFVSAHGTFDADSQGELVTFSNTIDATFLVTERADYHLTFGLTFDGFFGVPNGLGQEDFVSLKLRNTHSPSPLVSKEFEHQDLTSHANVAFSGPLQPGEYELSFALQDTFAARFDVGTYDLQFSADSGTQAVPLPPALWTGLLTLAGLAGAMWYGARRARVA